MNRQEKILISWMDTIKEVKKSASLGFCLSHLEILITVYLNDGITRQNLINSIENVSPTSLKRYVKDMVNEYGYINESSHNEDSRIKLLHISEKGQKLVEVILKMSCNEDL